MSAEYNAFARPTFTAADFGRDVPETGEPMFTAPIYARTTTKARGGINPAVWVAVPAVALAVGVGAYMLNREPVTVAATKPIPVAASPMLTPSEMAASAPVAPAAMTPNPTPEAAPVRAASSARVTDRAPPVRVARARPAAMSADTRAADVSATIPEAPQAYSGPAQSVVTPAEPTVVEVAPAVTPEAAAPPVAPPVSETTTPPAHS